jgi:hypothetical protein
MKRFVLALALITAHAQADVPEIMAKNVKCADLQAELVKNKSLTVVKSFLGIKKRLTVEVKADCDYDETNETAYFKTIDDKFCEVGEYCKAESIFSGGSSYDSGYSSGSSYDSGYSSGSSWSSGSSSSGSSSSGSSHGSNYNPPSSSSSGSNYNPPSSGSHGPRYCPSCAL